MRRNLFNLFLLPAMALAAGCTDGPSDASEQRIEYGTAVVVGNGTAKSYVVKQDDATVEIGIALSETALEGLPGGSTPQDAKSFLLPLPANHGTGYQVVEANWNPGGHPPPMVYTVPHFDFHFYVVSLAARDAILPTDPDFATKAGNLPPQADRPANYKADAIPGGATIAVPRMGVHWTNSASHEFHGSPFDVTFVVGSWNGSFTFLEPMVELSYLKSKPDFQAAAAVPGTFGAAGDRPAGYRVSWNAEAKEYRVALTGLGG